MPSGGHRLWRKTGGTVVLVRILVGGGERVEEADTVHKPTATLSLATAQSKKQSALSVTKPLQPAVMRTPAIGTCGPQASARVAVVRLSVSKTSLVAFLFCPLLHLRHPAMSMVRNEPLRDANLVGVLCWI